MKYLAFTLFSFIASSAIAQFNCGDTLIDTRDGQKYPTVEIGNQCWMAKNLNVGTMTDISIISSDDQNIEKYCYDGLPSNCDSTGGLYRWHEMMDYTFDERTQGICPEGWYLPTSGDWSILQGMVSSVPELLPSGSTGFDALYARPIEENNTYGGSPDIAYFWSSSINNGAQYRIVTLSSQPLYEENTGFDAGMSVRCLIPDDIVGLKQEQEANNYLVVFPSPSAGEITVELNLPSGFEKATLVVRNVLGEIISQQPLQQFKGAQSLSVQEQENGVYFVEVLADDNVIATKKFILQR